MKKLVIVATAMALMIVGGPASAEGGKYCGPTNLAACVSSLEKSADEASRMAEDPGSAVGDDGAERDACVINENNINYGEIGGFLAPWIDSSATCAGAVSVSIENAIQSTSGFPQSGASHWNCLGAWCGTSAQAGPGVLFTTCYTGAAVAEPVPGTFTTSTAAPKCFQPRPITR